jgi:type IV pilus assembly protein PilC
MPSFAYTARETATGREIRNSMEAATEQAAIAALLNRNLLVVSIAEKISRKGKTQGGKVSLADLVVFTRQLATMIDAGIAIVQALQALADQTPNKVMRDVIRDICARVKAAKVFRKPCKSIPRLSTGFIIPWFRQEKKAVCWRKSWPAWPLIWKTPTGCGRKLRPPSCIRPP